MYVSGITFFMYAQSRKIRKPNKCARISILSPTIFYWTLELFLQCSIVDAILLHVVIDITLIVFYCMLLSTLHSLYFIACCYWHYISLYVILGSIAYDIEMKYHMFWKIIKITYYEQNVDMASIFLCCISVYGIP
jgi:hypothetical protein